MKTSVGAGIAIGVVCAIGIIWYSSALGFRVLPSESPLSSTVWTYTGVFLIGAIPTALFFRFDLLSPVILLIISLILWLEIEATPKSESLILLPLFWPVLIFLFLLSGWAEWTFR